MKKDKVHVKGKGLKHFRLLEVEVHSFCNRLCDWCPNTKIDRHSEQINLDEDIYIELLSDLKIYGFDGAISYSRYNEPFADVELLRTRVAQAREIFPRAKLVSNTNGDYLTASILDSIGLDEVSIMDYDNKGTAYMYKLKQLGVDNIYGSTKYVYGNTPNTKVMCALNWSKNARIENRGGALTTEDIKHFPLKGVGKRIEPCKEPMYFIGVDYNGNVTPCCHIRSDVPKHENFILGNLNNERIYDILMSDKAVEFREQLRDGEFASPCTYCHKSPGRYTTNKPSMRYKE